MSVKTMIIGALITAIGVSTGTMSLADAQSTTAARPYYVALGDSVAAGDGLPTGRSADDVRCGRSPSAYPSLVAASLVTSVSNLSCTGAGAYYGIIKSQTVGASILPSQLDRAFQYGKPDLITITAGANDTQWADFLQRCGNEGCGQNSRLSRAWLDVKAATYRKILQANMLYTLYKIDANSNGTTAPRVLVSGYYNPISNVSCTAGRLSSSDLTWINKQVTGLNDDIRGAVNGANRLAGYTYATYVPVNFSNHGICSADPWVQGPGDAAPIHPNTDGQQAIARSFLQYVK